MSCSEVHQELLCSLHYSYRTERYSVSFVCECEALYLCMQRPVLYSVPYYAWIDDARGRGLQKTGTARYFWRLITTVL